MKKTLMVLVATVMAVALLSGCGKKKAGSFTEQIKAKGKIVVYTNPEFPPYEYMGANGQIDGAEIEMVKKIAEKLGVQAEFVSAEFDSIIGSVTTGKADLGASGFTINDERKQVVSFSIPFVVSVQYLIVPENSAIKTVEDLAGKKIGGQNGTTGFLMVEDCIKDGVLKGTNASAKSYNNAPDAVVAMKAGQVDAVVIDDLVAKSLAKKNPGFKAIEMVTKDGKGLDLPEEFGLMVNKGNEDILVICNDVISEMRANGSLEEIINKHQDITTLAK
ncbi:MAG: transporter substrate-binding domain-containing protein [Victivallales bacterium]|nr:transporter substrate-binding domain-containing protein [Victivallales bacterium]